MQELELLERQGDVVAADDHLVAGRVERDVADLEHVDQVGRVELDASPGARRSTARIRATSSRSR